MFELKTRCFELLVWLGFFVFFINSFLKCSKNLYLLNPIPTGLNHVTLIYGLIPPMAGRNRVKKTAKAKNFVTFIRRAVGQHILSHIDWESKENYSKFGQKVSKYNLEFRYFLSEDVEAVWGQKSSKWLIRLNFHYWGPH